MSDFVKENNETMQRMELHRKIWAIADDVRGAVDSLYLELDATQYELTFSMDWQRWDNKKNSGIIYYIGIRLYKHENYVELNFHICANASFNMIWN